MDAYTFLAGCILIILSVCQTAYAGATQEPITMFSNPAFWAKLPAATAARAAWREGAALKKQCNGAVLYHNGYLYGYAAARVPVDNDKSVQGRLNENYASRAEMRNIQLLGVTAFNDFQCEALADFPQMQPDMRLCSEVRFSEKFTGVSAEQAFSIAALSSENICSCLKALDLPVQGDNANIFYAPIAVNELERLHKEQNFEGFIVFFENNYRRRIFAAPALLMAAGVYADRGAAPEALALLDAITGHFAQALTSEQYESCGDLYYRLGRKQSAASSYQQAERLFNQ
jgi:tetratricopeptide (TPR) repeat protein